MIILGRTHILHAKSMTTYIIGYHVVLSEKQRIFKNVHYPCCSEGLKAARIYLVNHVDKGTHIQSILIIFVLIPVLFS